jgi:two-component system, response regulator
MESSEDVALYIIVADDDIENHNLIREAIRECERNNIVTSVYNGRQLLDLLLQRGFYKHEYPHLPDLILLDLDMPIMSGLKALKKIKLEPLLKRIPVILLSETDTRKRAEEGLKLGADDVLAKPFESGRIKKLVSDLCKGVNKPGNDSPGLHRGR